MALPGLTSRSSSGWWKLSSVWHEGISNPGCRMRDVDGRTDFGPRPLTMALAVSIDPNSNLFRLSYGLPQSATHLMPQRGCLIRQRRSSRGRRGFEREIPFESSAENRSRLVAWMLRWRMEMARKNEDGMGRRILLMKETRENKGWLVKSICRSTP